MNFYSMCNINVVEMSKEKLINIRRGSDDPFDRYKMPEIKAVQRNDGSYNSTFINNITDIAKSLHVNAECLIKYISVNLNTSAKFDEKNKMVILKGFFRGDLITKNIHDFIDLYILCKKCKLPELKFSIEDSVLIYRCNACGKRHKCDPRDKIYKILFNSLMKNHMEDTTDDEMIKETTALNIDIQTDGWSIDTSKEAAKSRLDENNSSKLLKDLFN